MQPERPSSTCRPRRCPTRFRSRRRAPGNAVAPWAGRRKRRSADGCCEAAPPPSREAFLFLQGDVWCGLCVTPAKRRHFHDVFDGSSLRQTGGRAEHRDEATHALWPDRSTTPRPWPLELPRRTSHMLPKPVLERRSARFRSGRGCPLRAPCPRYSGGPGHACPMSP